MQVTNNSAKAEPEVKMPTSESVVVSFSFEEKGSRASWELAERVVRNSAGYIAVVTNANVPVNKDLIGAGLLHTVGSDNTRCHPTAIPVLSGEFCNLAVSKGWTMVYVDCHPKKYAPSVVNDIQETFSELGRHLVGVCDISVEIDSEKWREPYSTVVTRKIVEWIGDYILAKIKSRQRRLAG